MDSAVLDQPGYRKFVPFIKVDAAKREVSGIVTAEVPDKEGETCDYFLSKPYFQSWSAEFEKATGGKSCGNLRLMHTLTVVGKGLDIDFRDESREVFMTFKVTDDKAWSDVEEGVLTGFSQGGKYVRKPDANGRYVASPSEVSLVDNPCLPTAHFAYIRGDGAVEMRKFKKTEPAHIDIDSIARPLNSLREISVMPPITVEQCLRAARGEDPQLTAEQIEGFGTLSALISKAKGKTKRVDGVDLPAHCFAFVGDKDKTETWKLPIEFPGDEEKTKSHIRNALSRFSQTEGIPAGEKGKVLSRIKAAAKKHGIDTAEKKCADALELVKAAVDLAQKGMYQVAQFAELLSELAWIQDIAEFEAEIEGDESKVPGDLLAQLKELCRIFLDMAEEEATELTEETDKNGGKAEVSLAAPSTLRKTSRLLARAAGEIKNRKDAGTPAEGQHVETTNNTGTDLGKGAGVLQHLKKAKELADSHRDALHSHIDKCMKAMGGDGDEDDKAAKAAAASAAAVQKTEPAVATPDAAGALAKAMQDQFQGVLKGMQDQFKAFMDELGHTLEAPKASQTGRAVTKAEDGRTGAESEVAAEPVFRAQGSPSIQVSEEYRKAMKSVRGAVIAE